MTTYLITGGAGFIGVNASHHYLTQGHRVIVLDNFSRAGTESNINWLKARHADRLTVVRADIRYDQKALDDAAAQADVLLHLAAQVAVTTSVVDPRTDFEVNALGTLNVLEAARRAPKPPIVVYSSTNKVFGKMDDVAVVEGPGRYSYANLPFGVPADRPLDFYSPYGCSKGTGDQYVVDYARIYGLRTVVFRQSCIYGPNQFGVEDQGWIAWFSIRALFERGVTIYGDGKQVRDALFVDDLIAVYDAAIAERIDPELAFPLVELESQFNERALSPVGAIGLTQLMLPTAREFDKTVSSTKLYDRETNLRIGFRYLRQLIKWQKGNVELALLAYNRGPGTVETAQAMDLDPANGYERIVLRGYRGKGILQ